MKWYRRAGKRALGDTRLDLAIQRVRQIVPCQWPDLGILVQRVAHSGSAHPLDK